MKTLGALVVVLFLPLVAEGQTRFRLTNDGTAPCSPSVQSYTHTTSTRRPLALNPVSSTLTTTAIAPDADTHTGSAGDTAFIQFISDPLAVQTFSAGAAFDFAIQGLEANASNNLNVQVFIGIVSNDCSSAIATLRSKVEETTEMATSLTNRYLTSTLSGSHTTTQGQRLVIEFSLEGTPAAAGGTQGHNGSLRFGTSGTGDLPEDDSSTSTTLNPWIEFAQTVLFVCGRASLMGVGCR